MFTCVQHWQIGHCLARSVSSSQARGSRFACVLCGGDVDMHGDPLDA